LPAGAIYTDVHQAQTQLDHVRPSLFDPLHAELEEAPLPGLAVGRIGHFRPFPNDLRARSRIFQTPKDFLFF
jgi:hypothetical protein